MAQLQTK